MVDDSIDDCCEVADGVIYASVVDDESAGGGNIVHDKLWYDA